MRPRYMRAESSGTALLFRSEVLENLACGEEVYVEYQDDLALNSDLTSPLCSVQNPRCVVGDPKHQTLSLCHPSTYCWFASA